jgi:hypothetical protein
MDGAGDGVELTEIQQLNQCIKQDTVNLDTVRYTVNAKGRSVRFHEHLTISQISSIGPAVKGASKWVEMQPFGTELASIASVDHWNLSAWFSGTRLT